MKLLTSLVSVKRINSSVPRSKFNEHDIEKASQAILDAEGIINPIILEKIDLESYEVFSGHFEYYAAAKAREIDPRKGEMISAFIIEDDKENSIKKQVEILRKSHDDQSITITDKQSFQTVNDSDKRLLNMELRLTNIETRFEKQIQTLQSKHKDEIEAVNQQLTEIKQRLPEPIDCLKALNTLSLSMLVSHLSRISIKNTILEKIVNEREENGEFKSCSDVVSRIKGLGDKTMIKIIDQFSN